MLANPARLTRIALGSLVLFACASAAQAEVTLRWKFPDGNETRYVMTMDMTQAMNLGGNAFEVKMKQTMDLTWKITAVDASGVATMSQTIDRIRMEMNSPMGVEKYDSSKPDEAAQGAAKMFAQVFQGMVKNPVSMKVTSLGELSDMKLPDNFLAGLKAIPGAAQMGGMFSEDGMKQMMSQSMLKLPQEPVTEGSKWSSKMDMNAGPLGKQSTEYAYTYAGPEQRDGGALEKIDAKIMLTFNPPKDSPLKLNVKENEGSGTLFFDNKAGRLQESNTRVKMVFEIEAGGQMIEQDVTAVSTLKLAEDQAKK